MDEKTANALHRLFDIAASDTGQSRRVASFLLAWHNAADLGGFDIADVFGVDRAIADDMATVFAFLGQQPGAIYARELGYQPQIEKIIARWRS